MNWLPRSHWRDRRGIALRQAVTAEEITACIPLLQKLRPSLSDTAALVEQIARQQGQGYRLLVAWKGKNVVGVAGYRTVENLIYGRFVYVDDLFVLSEARRSGLAARLIDAIASEGTATGCRSIVLDTGTGNSGAQEFYRRCGMHQTALHFTRQCAPGEL